MSRRDFEGFIREFYADDSRFFWWDSNHADAAHLPPLQRDVEIARREFLGTLRRAAAAGLPVFRSAPELPPSALEGCSVLTSREALLQVLPRHAVAAEIGTQYGFFARLILRDTQPRELHVVDIDLGAFPTEEFAAAIGERRLVLHERDSVDALSAFPDRYFDWIYLDADHSYDGARRDIAAAYDKLKPEGLLAFDDYTLWSPYEQIPYGVPQAVHELIRERGARIAYLTLDELGYPNVVVRKPAA